jgi:alcohol dehydrogenase class IV
MLSKKGNPMTDVLAVEAIRLIAALLPKLEHPQGLEYNERETLLYASMLAGAVIANTGTTVMHSMGYSLTYFRDIDHGRANGLLMAEFLRFIGKTRPDMTGRVLKAANFNDVDVFKTALSKLLGERETVESKEFEKFSSIAIKAWNVVNCAVVATENDLTDIYNASF